MSGLLARVARGIGAGAESYGQSMLEEQRQNRLNKIRSEAAEADRQFKVSERKASDASAGKRLDTKLTTDTELHKSTISGQNERNAATNATNLEIAKLNNKTKLQTSPNSRKSKASSVHYETVTDEFDVEQETGNIDFFIDDVQYHYDADSDTTTIRGRGKNPPKVDTSYTPEQRKEDESFASQLSNNWAGTFSGDSSDYASLPTGFQTEEGAANLISILIADARKLRPEKVDSIKSLLKSRTTPAGLGELWRRKLANANELIKSEISSRGPKSEPASTKPASTKPAAPITEPPKDTSEISSMLQLPKRGASGPKSKMIAAADAKFEEMLLDRKTRDDKKALAKKVKNINSVSKTVARKFLNDNAKILTQSQKMTISRRIARA